MLRLAPYFFEKGFVKEVTIAVGGHTNYAGDRLFNQLKLRYHKHNVYNIRQVIKVLNSQPNATAIKMDSHHFLDYEKMLDKLYHKLEAGIIQRKNVFSVKNNGDSIEMEKREHIDADAVFQNLLKKGQQAGTPERKELLKKHFYRSVQGLVYEKSSKWSFIQNEEVCATSVAR
jgi:hypothetical protein